MIGKVSPLNPRQGLEQKFNFETCGLFYKHFTIVNDTSVANVIKLFTAVITLLSA
jgi:hypothetical protein